MPNGFRTQYALMNNIPVIFCDWVNMNFPKGEILQWQLQKVVYGYAATDTAIIKVVIVPAVQYVR